MIRRALLTRWPALMREYGVMPWEVDQLRFVELKAMLDAQDERAKAQQRAAQQASRQRGRGR